MYICIHERVQGVHVFGELGLCPPPGWRIWYTPSKGGEFGTPPPSQRNRSTSPLWGGEFYLPPRQGTHHSVAEFGLPTSGVENLVYPLPRALENLVYPPRRGYLPLRGYTPHRGLYVSDLDNVYSEMCVTQLSS